MKDLQIINYQPDTESIGFTGLGRTYQTLRLQDNLIQRVIKSFLTIKGHNAAVAGFGTDYGKYFTKIPVTNANDLKQIMPTILDQIKEQIKATQVSNLTGLSPYEVLEDIKLISLEHDALLASWYITIDIQTKAGSARISIND